MSPAFFRILALCLTALIALSAEPTSAATDDDEDMFQNAKRASAGKTRSRAYVGARDEQGLEVQANLSQPTRNPDGTATVPDDEEPREPAPLSD